MLGEELTNDINDSVGAAEKKFSISFSKAKAKFSLSFHYNCNSSYLLISWETSVSLKLTIKISTLLLNFV